jgi:hypothetical protein
MYNNQWDQRIPNKPILDRNFILKKPPIILNERPYSTYCTGRRQIGTLNLHTRVNKKTEEEMRSFWQDNVVNLTEHGGLPLSKNKKDNFKANSNSNSNSNSKPGIKTADAPWMQSVHYNITADSTVKPYRPFLTKDCIKNNKVFDMNNDISNELTNGFLTVDLKKRVWDINTSFKMREDHRLKLN